MARGPISVARGAVRRLRRWYRQHPRRVFRHIHSSNAWGSDESRSGVGSTLEQTRALRAALPETLRGLGVSRLLDIPCGDWNWMGSTDLGTVEVIGADLVPAIVERNRRSYGHRATFEVLDARSSQLPRVDLIMARDLLVHLSYRDISAVFENFRRSGARFVMLTTFSDRERANRDIRTGDWRPLNLQLPPFSLPEPSVLIDEECTEYDGAFRDKAMAVWDVRWLPDRFEVL